MNKWTWKIAVIGAWLVIGAATSMVHAQRAAPDLVLLNGKVITVDDRFTIAEAIAVSKDRIVAVGANREIAQLAGPNTKKIDLKGKAVIPGIIENHAHFMRAGETWTQEVRLDGIESRKQAFEMLRARAKSVGPGEWVYTLGGWAHQQFADDRKPFTREELDQVAPNNPVLLQEAYYRLYLNTRAIQALGVDEMKPEAKWVGRDAAGKPTGVIEEAGVRLLASKIPVHKDMFEASSLAMIKDLNRAGLTALGNAGCDPAELETYRKWERQGQLHIRMYCINSFAAATPEETDKILPQISQIRLFQGDTYLDDIAYGESVYAPIHDDMLAVKAEPRPDQLEQWHRIATEVAKARMPLHVHATLDGSIDAFLNEIEQINKVYPVKNLRWAFAHLDQINESQLERMKNLGMYAAVGSRPPEMGGIFHDLHGDRSYDMPPLKLIQDSGIMWGFGSDATVVNQYRPFTILWWAVTGKMVGGMKVLRQPISREDALLAYTRKNAYLIFQENNLGSIQPGKLADLAVLDRDYLTVPADQIKDIKPVMTMVGGKIVYDADAP